MSTTTKLKRGLDEGPDNTKNTVTTPVPSKRQREETNSSKTPAAPMMPEANTNLNVPDDAVLKTYQQLLPENPEGITFLFHPQFSEALDAPAQLVATECGITKENAIEELRRLLAIKTFAKDELATKISPTPLMDELWHAAILDTQLYATLQAALGLLLHHRPSGASHQESESRGQRLIAMKIIYRKFFLSDPLEPASSEPASSKPSRTMLTGPYEPPMTILVSTREGATLRIIASGSTTIDDVKITLQELQTRAPNQMRLIFAGTQLEDHRSLSYYGIGDRDTLHLILRLWGC